MKILRQSHSAIYLFVYLGTITDQDILRLCSSLFQHCSVGGQGFGLSLNHNAFTELALYTVMEQDTAFSKQLLQSWKHIISFI